MRLSQFSIETFSKLDQNGNEDGGAVEINPGNDSIVLTAETKDSDMSERDTFSFTSTQRSDGGDRPIFSSAAGDVTFTLAGNLQQQVILSCSSTNTLKLGAIIFVKGSNEG